MKRFHVHVSVKNLDSSIEFYSTMFGMRPAVLKPDYAKWMLEDPRVNFAISKYGSTTGIDHLVSGLGRGRQALRAQVAARGSPLRPNQR
jgi:catechol 2,3-dioxygenase-like lactoylglutathione lyase family enzyme